LIFPEWYLEGKTLTEIERGIFPFVNESTRCADMLHRCAKIKVFVHIDNHADITEYAECAE
jgi:hypothetical protein